MPCAQIAALIDNKKSELEADLVALKQASKSLDKLIKSKGINIESVIEEFNAARKKPLRQPE